jgi:hypothetical protein
MQSPPYIQNQDEEHLRLLSLFHRILGCIWAVFAFCPGIYVFMGIMMLTVSYPASKGGPPLPRVADPVGWVFIAIGGGLMLLLWAVAICIFVVAAKIERRTHYGFCFAIACIECLFQPLGTALGVFTLVVLTRQSVKALFDHRTPVAVAPTPREDGAQPGSESE